MKNKSFVGIDISKNVIDVSIFREDTNIKMFPHEVFNNTRKGFGDMCSWLKKSRVVLSQALFGMEFTGCYSWTWKNSSRPRITLSVCLVHV